MVEAGLNTEKSFVLQKKTTPSSQQPLEIYHLSHDLRGPLNSILGFAELLLEGVEGPLNDYQKTDITAIYQSAQNLLHLINTLVDLSKLEADLIHFAVEPVDLAKILENVLASDFGGVKPEHVELVYQIPADLPPIFGDRSRIEQMVWGLLRFIFKVKKKGQIIIEVESDEKEIAVSMEVEGVTIPTEELASLCELMVHLDATGRSELGRGGLELPLAQRLAIAQRGRVWVENRENWGIILNLRLPIRMIT